MASDRRYARRHRQYESKNLNYTFSTDEEPQEKVTQEHLPSPQCGRTIESQRWRRLLRIRSPSRRVLRRFAIVVHIEDSSTSMEDSSTSMEDSSTSMEDSSTSMEDSS
jgi:hypothetical protein